MPHTVREFTCTVLVKRAFNISASSSRHQLKTLQAFCTINRDSNASHGKVWQNVSMPDSPARASELFKASLNLIESLMERYRHRVSPV